MVKNNKNVVMRKGKTRRQRVARPAIPNVKSRDRNELVQRSLPLFPSRYKAMLRYADSFTLSVTSGAVASYVFSANGLYDPNITGTGHQPAGFDQMMLSYEHYCVVSAKCYAYFHNVTTTAAPTVAISVSAAATPVTNSQQLMEDGIMVSERVNYASTEGSLRALEIKTNVSRFGGLREVLDNSDYRGSVSANPTEQQYFHVQAWDTETATCAIGVDVVIEYVAWFTEPRKVSQSLLVGFKRLLLQEEKRHCT